MPSQCLLTFEVENSGPVSKTVELIIKPKLDASGAPLPCNFRVPQSVIPCEVYSNTSKHIIHLTKLDPEIQEWGDFEWSFRLREKNNNPYLGSSSAVGSGTGGYGANTTGDYFMQGDTPANDDVGGDTSAFEKACPVCTLNNPISYTHCDACQSAL